VLILDEPFNGMDPEGIIWVRGLLRSLAAEGRTVLVSSHLLSELEGMADDLIVVGRGRVLAHASVEELLGGVQLSGIGARRTTLEQVYLQLTSGQAEFSATSDGEAGR
jgi:ABC-2 type transport system ATP-binding protein